MKGGSKERGKEGWEEGMGRSDEGREAKRGGREGWKGCLDDEYMKRTND